MILVSSPEVGSCFRTDFHLADRNINLFRTVNIDGSHLAEGRNTMKRLVSDPFGSVGNYSRDEVGICASYPDTTPVILCPW